MPPKGLLFDVNENEALPLYVDYSIGAGLRFDGVNDYVNLPAILPSAKPNDDFSLSIWITPITINNLGFITPIFSKSLKDSNSSNDYKGFTIVSSSIGIDVQYVNNNIQDIKQFRYITPENILGKLCHFVWDNLNQKMYYNGIELTKIIVSDTGTDFNYPNYNESIGQVYQNEPYHAQEIYYDLKIFNKSLSQQEVEYLYQTKGSITPSTALANLVFDMRFNQKTGTTAIDSSPNAYNGTLVNFLNTSPSAGNAWVDDLGNSILI